MNFNKKYIIVIFMCLATVSHEMMAQKISSDCFKLYISQEQCATIMGCKFKSLCTDTVLVPQSINYDNTWYRVIRIGEGAFSSCKQITNVVMEKGIIELGAYSFYECERLKSIKLSASIESIGNDAFCACYQLEDICLPCDVHTIGNNAFAYCRTIQDIILPAGTTYIGLSAFNSCANLSSITFPDSLKSIELNTCYNCHSLKAIVIGARTQSIEGNAFTLCKSIESVICKATTPPHCHESSFNLSSISTAHLFVPAESIQKYKQTSPWNQFRTISEIEGR